MYFTQKYRDIGVPQFYTSAKESYFNPHEPIIKEIVLKYCQNYKSVLDLACGSGEVSRYLPKNTSVTGCDPYLYNLYKKNTQNNVIKKTFDDIALDGLESYWEAIVCSFALHLVAKSKLPKLLWALAQYTDELVVISPTKNPHIKVYWDLEEIAKIKSVYYFRYKNKV